MCPHFSVISGSALRKQEVTTGSVILKKGRDYWSWHWKGKETGFFVRVFLTHHCISVGCKVTDIGYIESMTRDWAKLGAWWLYHERPKIPWNKPCRLPSLCFLLPFNSFATLVYDTRTKIRINLPQYCGTSHIAGSKSRETRMALLPWSLGSWGFCY